jgi:hypothetical protein
MSGKRETVTVTVEADSLPIFVTFVTISNQSFFLALPISLIYCAIRKDINRRQRYS